MTIEPISLLRQVFPGMTEDALMQMVALAHVRTYPPQTVLCREGAEEEVFYILGEGQVIVTQKLGTEDRLLRFGGPGQYFGEMALIANTPRNATVRTTIESTVLEIDKTTFVEMIRQNPIIALTMFRTTVGWLRVNDTAAISLLSQQKKEIEEAYQELQIQERRRTEFLTTLAHELRTPLTSASGYMQLIKTGTMTGPALTMGMSKVSDGLERIVSLINDLLFIQEMELIEPIVRPVNLSELLKILVDEASDDALTHNLAITLQVPESLPQVEGDPDGLLRAFRALVDNAIKFSPEGGEIRVEVFVNPGYMDVAFIDPGIGIEPDFLPRIFERFERQEKRGDYLFGGIGLGLSIAKHLVESFGGAITVESEIGRGSIFTVHLPVLLRDNAQKISTQQMTQTKTEQESPSGTEQVSQADAEQTA
jgi:signal transduction histidine kinase